MSALPSPEILRLGLRDYQEIWTLQRERQRALIAEEQDECIIFCSHPPTITLGTSSKREHLLLSEAQLLERGIKTFSVERGGDVTYHAPGQLVCYPIISLARRKRDVSWYMRLLEESVIRTLIQFNVVGVRIPGKTGVWMTDHSEKKIASIGVRLSRWCAMHGLALNVQREALGHDLVAGFSSIVPCGIQNIAVTTLEHEAASDISFEAVQAGLEANLITLLSEWQSFKL